MEILTKDNRQLWVIRFGEVDKVSSKILCEDSNGEKVVITYSDIKENLGCYSMPPRVREGR